MKKKTTLTIETERVVAVREAIRGRRASSCATCEACGETVKFIGADEAAALARISARALYRMAEAGKLHFIETFEGSLLICSNSLRRSAFGAAAPFALKQQVTKYGGKGE